MGNIADDWFGIESPTPPKAPNPNATADTQYEYNRQAALDQAMLNAIDQYGPYGSTIWARRPDGTPYAQSVTLSPEVQGWLDSQFGASTALQNAAQQQLGYLPTDKFALPTSPDAREYAAQGFGEKALDYSQFADPLAGDMYQSTKVGAGQTTPIDFASTQQSYSSPYREQQYGQQVNAQNYNPVGYESRFNEQALTQAPGTQNIANTFYEQAVSRFQPQLDEARKAKSIELAQRGIPVGSEIYKDEMNRLDRSANQAYSDAARQAELAAGQEQSRLYGQNLSSAQFGASENQRGISDAQFAANLGMTEEQFRAQFGSGEDARRLANQQFAAQFGSGENQRNVADTQFGSQFGQSEDARQFNQALQSAGYYDQGDLTRRQFQSAEDARMAGADLSNRQFLGTQENQQFNRLAQALGYGSGQYQTNLSNQLLERNQPFAEAAALMGTSPNFQTPSFQGATPTSVAAPDYAGLVSNNYNQAMNAYNNAQTNSATNLSGLMGAAGKIGAGIAGNYGAIFSDENLKEDREPADGEHILALMSTMPVDNYRYKDGAQAALGVPERRTGPMAQDYAERFPEGSDGRRIDIGDTIGKLMAAMKALDRRTQQLSPRMA